MGAFGAIACPDHKGRLECSHEKRGGRGRCHEQAVKGTDTCDGHAGKPREEIKAEGQVALTLAAAMEQLPRSHPGEVLLKAGHAAHVLLDRLVEENPNATGSVRQLELLTSAIDRAARIAKAALDADAQDRWVRAQESVASRDWEDVKALLSGVLGRLGRSWDEPEVVAAVRAELEAGERP